MASAQLAERVHLANFRNIAMREPNGALVKTRGGNGKRNATATSAEFIAAADSKRRGISCRVSQDFTVSWMIGLVSAPSGQQEQPYIAESFDHHCLTYAARMGWDHALYVYENFKSCGRFGSLQVGDYIEIVLNSEKPPSIEYRINGNLQYKSETPIVFPLFPKICAHNEGPLVEDLRWIVDPVTELVEPQADIAQLQIQLRKREEEKQDLRTSAEAKQAENEALLATIEQQKKELKAGNDALAAVTKEKAELLVQLEGAREASWAVSNAAKADEKLEMQIRAYRLLRENEALGKAIGDLAEEKVQLQLEKKQMHAEMQVLRRQLLQSDGASSEDWEEVSSSGAGASSEDWEEVSFSDAGASSEDWEEVSSSGFKVV